MGLQTTGLPRATMGTPLSRVQRWLLAVIGIALVGVGAVGVFLPGLPTTVFLIGASWCFARSCPWLEERLIRVPLFRPFLGYLDQGAAMPQRVVVTTLVVMWLAIAISTVVMTLGGQSRPMLAALIIALGGVGTVFIVRRAAATSGEDLDTVTEEPTLVSEECERPPEGRAPRARRPTSTR